VLVESEQGPWVVREDGSKRLLGDYDEATWSPRGLFVAVTAGRELIAVEPDGDVRWTIDAPAAVHDPRWGGIGFDTRIAYRSGGDLWVVDGDGSDARMVARDVAPLPPAWRPPPAEAKVAPEDVPAHVLGYFTRDRSPRAIDVDTGERVEPPAAGEWLSPSGDGISAAISPDGRHRAVLGSDRGRSTLAIVGGTGSARPRVLFSGPGRFTGPTWSPDGDWLLVGWPQADQWVFIRTDHPRRAVAIDRISEQFDPGDTGAGGFPRVSGWILPQR
jgi:hypothetical protein